MIDTSEIQRVFKYNGITLPDPNPSMSVDAVKTVFAAQYPELAAAESSAEFKGNQQIITFQKVVGHKG